MILARGEGRERARERNVDVRENQSVASGTRPSQDRASNRTHGLSVSGTMLQPTEPHQPEQEQFFNSLFFFLSS